MSPKKDKKDKAKKATLLESGDLSHALTAALEQVFRRFDVDGDGALSIDELQAFARACNDGEEFGEDELEDLKFFQTNASGHLTTNGFLQMYHTQTTARPADTWQDLKALGFDSALTLQPEQTDTEGAAGEITAPKKIGGDVSGQPSAPLPSVVVTAVDYCKQSDALYTDGKHDAALRSALAAVQLDGACAEAHRCAGRAFHALGRIEQGERSWLRANELAADSGQVAAADDVSDASAEAGRDEAEAAGALCGQQVELIGLSKAELNGQRGIARTYDAGRGRMAVEVIGQGTLSIKPHNLRRVSAEAVELSVDGEAAVEAPAHSMVAAPEVVPPPEAPATPEAPAATPEASNAASGGSAAESHSFDDLRRAVNELHDALEALEHSVDGTAAWAMAVLATYVCYGRAEQLLGAEQPMLRSVRPEWRASPKTLLAVAERVTDALPQESAAWAMRADACMGIPMGSSIASEFYEKAEALAPEGPARADFAAKKAAAEALFLTNMGLAGEQLERLQANGQA